MSLVPVSLFSVTEIERKGALDLSEPLEKMLPYLGINFEGKFKPALVFKEDDPLGISVINRRIEGNLYLNKARNGPRSVARFCSFLKLCKKSFLSIIF